MVTIIYRYGTSTYDSWNSAQFISQLPGYNRINYTKSLASGAGNISEPWIMSQTRRVCEVVCVCVCVCRSVCSCGAVVPVFICLHSICSHVTGVGEP
jgi:hypothetical protein